MMFYFCPCPIICMYSTTVALFVTFQGPILHAILADSLYSKLHNYWYINQLSVERLYFCSKISAASNA